MMKSAPHFLQRYSAALSSAAILVAVLVAAAVGVRDWAGIASLAGVALSLVYFYQSQRLEQTRLLKELVTDFNARYDKLNDALNYIADEAEIAGAYDDRPIEAYLDDYFNLCAEEYLFFKRGYIPAEVWTSWKNGMAHFCRTSPAIAKRWGDELHSGSYYGFDLSLLDASVPGSVSASGRHKLA
ncbi:hypothetical protein [Rubrivirga sp. IMCC43871]|uniref:hypothetical protein n=1 Tax=Rubrivirga sp. IMCC43871 TaxID=3391575 RepID=UPI00398FCF7E